MAPSIPTNSDVPRFFTLPLELRYMVYQLLLVPAYGANDKEPGPNGKDPKYHVQIMGTCRKIHDEAAEVFWKKNLWVGLHFSHGSKGSLALRDLGMDRMVSKHEPELSKTVLQVHVFCFETFRKISTTYIILNASYESDLLNGFLQCVSYRSWDLHPQISFGKRSLARPLFEKKFSEPLAVSLRPGLFSCIDYLEQKILSRESKLHHQMDVLRIHFRSILATIKLLDQQNSTSAAIDLAANCSKIRRASALRAIDDLKEHAPPESRADLLKLTISLAAYKMALKLSTPDEALDMCRPAASLRELCWSTRMSDFTLERDQIQAVYLYLKAIWAVNRNILREMTENLCMAGSLSVPSGNKFGIHEIYCCWVNRPAWVNGRQYMKSTMKRMMIKSIELDRLDKLLGI
ncbi:MAG: hypothetical protein LQ342_004914 [Letrouitia transgressa]|nr:MAG: hypothetical protein LQ342_004914 [Letrouitia transgressa]